MQDCKLLLGVRLMVVCCMQGFLALFSGDTGEIRSEVREQIDAKVGKTDARWLGAWPRCCEARAPSPSPPWVLVGSFLQLRLLLLNTPRFLLSASLPTDQVLISGAHRPRLVLTDPLWCSQTHFGADMPTAWCSPARNLAVMYTISTTSRRLGAPVLPQNEDHHM